MDYIKFLEGKKWRLKDNIYTHVVIPCLATKVFEQIDFTLLDENQYIVVDNIDLKVLVYYDIFNELIISVSLY